MTFADLDLSKSYSYADYLTWHFADRVELIEGKLFKMSPAPNRMHQTLVLDIAILFRSYLKGKPCKVFVAPFDVRLSRKSTADTEIINVVQPDVCVVCDEAKLDYKGCLGASDIVVEILSPGNNTVELRNKYDLYELSGVKEYWLVSPQDSSFMAYTLCEGRYTPSRLMTLGDTVTSTVLADFTIDLTELFNSAE
ncbi:MAG: Uma2 family endonuclease [Bacteroidota bacterium]